MYKNLRWKVLTIVAVMVVFGGLGVYPLLSERYGIPEPKWLAAFELKLGLDLRGGVQLQLRVNTDDALKYTTATTSEQLRDSLKTSNITVGAITVDSNSPTHFTVDGVTPDHTGDFRAAADQIAGTDYDINPGLNGRYEFTMKPTVVKDLTEQTVDQELQTIDRRVNALGVSEASIARQSQGDQILVQLPGVTDVAHARDVIGSTARLEFRLVEAGPMASKDDLLKPYNGQAPPDMEILLGSPEPGESGSMFYLMKKIPPVTGQDLRDAKPGLDENNQPAVMFEMKPEGAAKFGKLTGENIGRYLAIILDNRVVSAPRIDGRITDNGRISGGFTPDRANDLSLVLRSGALPASLTYLEQNVVGPTLGADSIRSGVIASSVGMLLIIGFMLAYYKLSGINAAVALTFNLIILLGLMAYIGATMTLPGIAGFVLTMGVGVDSNVLIFERIKEELAAQRGVRASINTGFDRVFWTLFDTHLASLIAAAFLFQFGTGPIRGFATTLSIGLMVNLFTSIFVSKTLYELELSARQTPSISI